MKIFLRICRLAIKDNIIKENSRNDFLLRKVLILANDTFMISLLLVISVKAKNISKAI